MWRFDETFQHGYACEVQPDLDGREGPRYYIPAASFSGGRDGVTVKVVPPLGEAWIGTFAFGTMPNGLSGVFTTPDVAKLLVVTKGDGYLVSTNDPEQWERVATVPTTDVRSDPKHGIIVLASFTHLVAYNQCGLVWKTEQLSWDNLKIISINDDDLVGEFWDLRTETKQRFAVDLKTGTATGGAVLLERKLSRR
jgi:hypothetical protein